MSWANASTHIRKHEHNGIITAHHTRTTAQYHTGHVKVIGMHLLQIYALYAEYRIRRNSQKNFSGGIVGKASKHIEKRGMNNVTGCICIYILCPKTLAFLLLQ